LCFFSSCASLSDIEVDEGEESDPYDSDEDKAPARRASTIQVAPSPVSSIHFFPVKEVPVKQGAKGATAPPAEPQQQQEKKEEGEEKPVFNDYSFWRAPLLDLDLTGVDCDTEDDEEEEDGKDEKDTVR